MSSDKEHYKVNDSSAQVDISLTSSDHPETINILV